MKKTILLFSLLFFVLMTNAQTGSSPSVSVEKSIFGVQVGVLGAWVYHEDRISNSIALRSEIGLDAGLFGGSIYKDVNRVNYAFAPVITLTPRWYYNLKKRLRKGFKIDQNNGNFFGLEISYNPSWFLISNVSNAEVFNQIRIIPKWAIRRTVGRHFSYETGIGLGYRHTFLNDDYYYISSDKKSSLVLDLHVRLGYTF